MKATQRYKLHCEKPETLTVYSNLFFTTLIINLVDQCPEIDKTSFKVITLTAVAIKAINHQNFFISNDSFNHPNPK